LACYIKLEKWEKAESEAESKAAMAMMQPGQSGSTKAMFRRGTARRHLGKLEEAKADLLSAAKGAPQDKVIRLELERCEEAIEAYKQAEKVRMQGMFAKSDAASTAAKAKSAAVASDPVRISAEDEVAHAEWKAKNLEKAEL